MSTLAVLSTCHHAQSHLSNCACCACGQLGKWEQSRRNLGLPDALGGDPQLEALAASCAPTADQLQHFIRACTFRYRRKVIDPGGVSWLSPHPECGQRAHITQELGMTPISRCDIVGEGHAADDEGKC